MFLKLHRIIGTDKPQRRVHIDIPSQMFFYLLSMVILIYLEVMIMHLYYKVQKEYHYLYRVIIIQMQQTKFIGLILHLIATTMLYFSYPDNIISAYPQITSYSDSNYVGAKTSFLAANILTVIGLVVQFIILFVGVNLFKERHSFLLATLHLMGAILYISYGFGQWQFSTLWALWAVFSLLPLLLEIMGACHPSNK